MTSIHVELKDGISPKVSSKLMDVANAAERAGTAVQKLTNDLRAIGVTQVNQLSSAKAKLTAETKKASNAAKAEAVSQKEAARAASQLEASKRSLLRTTDPLRYQILLLNDQLRQSDVLLSKNALGAAEHSSMQIRLQKELKRTTADLKNQTKTGVMASRSRRQGLHQTQNLIYQLNDVVVGLGSGQKPMTVLLQQGSQISTIFGPGHGVLGTFRLLGATMVGIFAPLLPFIGIVAALGAGVFALQKSIQSLTGVSVGFGDTFKAIFQVAGRAIHEYLKPALEIIARVGKSVFGFLAGVAKGVINKLIGSMVAAGNYIRIFWQQTGNIVKQGFATTINAIVISAEKAINAIRELLGLSKVSFQQYKMDVKDSLGGAIDDIIDSTDKAFNTDYLGTAGGVLDDYIAIVGKQAVANKLAADSEEKKQGALSESQKLYNDIQAPMIEYNHIVKYGNELLAQGLITLAQYNEKLNSTQLVSGLTNLKSSLPGYTEEGGLDQLQQEYNQRLSIIDTAERTITGFEAEAQRLRLAALLDYNKKKNALLTSDTLSAYNSYEQGFKSISSITKQFAGETSDTYRAMFAVSKGFAIAQSIINIQKGISDAWTQPFPLNIAAAALVASETASIVSNIQSVREPSAAFKNGGFISGAGTGRSDEIDIRASNGEFMINAAATRRNRPLLESINSGIDVGKSVGGGGDIIINNYADGAEVTTNRRNDGVTEIEVRNMIAQDTPNIIANELTSANSKVSKSLGANTTAERRRS